MLHGAFAPPQLLSAAVMLLSPYVAWGLLLLLVPFSVGEMLTLSNPTPDITTFSVTSHLAPRFQVLSQRSQGTLKGSCLLRCNNLFLCLSLLDDKLLKPRTVPWPSQLPAQCLAHSKCFAFMHGMMCDGDSLASTCGVCILDSGDKGACRGTLVLVISFGEHN